MAEMMKQMEGMAEGGDFQNVLEGMMEQLMSKDILYEPMVDLQQKVIYFFSRELLTLLFFCLFDLCSLTKKPSFFFLLSILVPSMA